MSPRLALGAAAVLGAGIPVVLWGVGRVLNEGNHHVVRFDGETLQIQAKRKSTSDQVPQVFVLTDELVMGATYGKGLRLLLDQRNIAFVVDGEFPQRPPVPDWIISAGEAASILPDGEKVIFLAPSTLSEKAARSLVESREEIVVFLPGYDEDGRVAFWREMADRHPTKIRLIPFLEYGNDLTQAWPEIVQHLESIL